ncbi:MAG: Rieske (2Fe-2S) protein [Deltaproteobacteria bacterium]|nr:Rieske (2Fe-2S) protein [Deltaproteobacteria bacterium]MBW2291798.1 Rieske (2Fe-2S) protein [Deltaproteobacteria bacterium]MBW2724918.1 Rieske (2Fe-2S) protein [Deltaproteobacteria bacterium]
MIDDTSVPQVPRRKVLDVLLKVTLLGWLGSVLYPIISYLKPLPQQGPTGPVGLTRVQVEKVEREKFAIVPVGTRRVLVLEDGDGELHALDARCTHEGCTVRYVPGEALISCACHNARFDLTGRVLAGPPPRPLAKHRVMRDAEGGIVVAVSSA